MNKYDLIIIGGASAGLTAAIYAGRKKLNTIILTKEVGGQSLLTDNIENYPGFESITGKELVEKFRKHAEKYGVPIKEKVEIASIEEKNGGFAVKTNSGETYEAKSLIIATGKTPRHLNVPGEKEFINKGVSYCSICDAPLFGGKDVAVVGGGNAGLEAALDLTKYANEIYVLEFAPKLAGDESTQELLRKTQKVEFITNAETQKIQGEQFVTGIIYKDRTSNEIKELKVGGVFVNIGWIPATNFVKGFLELNKWGEIIVKPETGETSRKGIFAAGDATNSLYKQCIIAAGEGAKAALSAYEYLIKKPTEIVSL